MFPPSLSQGDTIAIVSPSSIIKPQNVYKAIPVLNDQGWLTRVGQHAFDRYGTYAGTDADRLADLSAALTDPAVNAILCSRGGYGAVHLLESLARLPLESNPKWIIGFSDISALHALMTSRGIASIHAPMTKHIAEYGADDPDTASLFSILRGESVSYELPPHPADRTGSADGMLVGGNLAVIAGLIGTPFDVLKPGRILFIEDVAEPIYKIERIFYQLRLSGVLAGLAGLIVGRFTNYSGDDDNPSMEAMIQRMVAPYDYPVAFGAPIGHVHHNIPLICGAGATLTVTPAATRITQ